MIADAKCHDEITALVHETLKRLSTPGSNLGDLLTHPDMAIAGSRLGDDHRDFAAVQALAHSATMWEYTWTSAEMSIWREGDIAWGQILVSVQMPANEKEEPVPYRIFGIFARDKEGWHWRYWGGSQSKEAEVR